MRYRSALQILVASAAFTGAPHAGADSSGKWKSPQEAYEKVCAYCHDTNIGPVLAGRNLPSEYILTMVRMGNRAMPAFRPTELDDQLLAGVARYIATKEAKK